MIVKKTFQAYGWRCANPTIRGVTARRLFKSHDDAARDAANTLPLGEPYNVFSYDLSDQAATDLYGPFTE